MFAPPWLVAASRAIADANRGEVGVLSVEWETDNGHYGNDPDRGTHMWTSTSFLIAIVIDGETCFYDTEIRGGIRCLSIDPAYVESADWMTLELTLTPRTAEEGSTVSSWHWRPM